MRVGLADVQPNVPSPLQAVYPTDRIAIRINLRARDGSIMQNANILDPRGPMADALARGFGLDKTDASKVLAALAPELSRAVERNTLNRGGIADLIATLGQADYQKALDPDFPLSSPGVRDSGIPALETIFGNKDASRAVADRAARASGVDASLIRQMLPAIATLAMGALSKTAGNQIDNILAQVQAMPGSPLPLPGGAPQRPAPSIAPAPAPRTGNGVGHQQPLPVPGHIPDLGRTSNPYEDLSDVIRRGGTRLPQSRGPRPGESSPAPSGGSLDSVIRDILGGSFGFENRGFLGWLLRAVVLRYGWQILQWLMRRFLSAR